MKLTAAVIQTSSVLLDTPATVERALGLMKEAAAQGAQVLVFPEAFLGGYPKGADFHIYLGGRTLQGRTEFKLYFDAAVCVDGPEIAQLAKAAKEYRLYVCVGIIERDGGTLYCTAWRCSSHTTNSYSPSAWRSAQPKQSLPRQAEFR